jgi:hypothetical protein
MVKLRKVNWKTDLLEVLRNHLQNQNPQDFKFEDFIENGIVNYKFKITSGDYAFYYVIRPQYELGPTNGVKYNTRSDFYISLSSIEKDGTAIEDDGCFIISKRNCNLLRWLYIPCNSGELQVL